MIMGDEFFFQQQVEAETRYGSQSFALTEQFKCKKLIEGEKNTTFYTKNQLFTCRFSKSNDARM